MTNANPPAQGTPNAGVPTQTPTQTPEPKAGNPPPANAPQPEKYDLKVPNGALLDSSHVEKIAAYARERGLSQEDAQKVLERDNSILMSYAERQKAQTEEARNSWAEATKLDKELGGEKLPQTVEVARRVLDRFGSEEFKQQLNETGLGNHPELIRILSRIGKVLSSDQTILGGAPAKPIESKSAAEIIYGTKE